MIGFRSLSQGFRGISSWFENLCWVCRHWLDPKHWLSFL